MGAPTHVADVAALQAEHCCPVLFVDTCSLLDLIRLPYRTANMDYLHNEVDAARTVLNAARERPRRVISVLAPPVPDEFRDNVASETRNLAVKLKEHRKMAEIVHQAEITLGSAQPTTPVTALALDEIGVRLRTLAQDIIDVSVHLETDAALNEPAMARVRKRTPPAARGQQAKDCLIIEHVLACAHHCSGYDVVFISSNKKDYCDGTSRLRPPLDREFADVKLVYKLNWQAARAALQL